MSWYYSKLLCRVDQKCHVSFSSHPGCLYWICHWWWATQKRLYIRGASLKPEASNNTGRFGVSLHQHFFWLVVFHVSLHRNVISSLKNISSNKYFKQYSFHVTELRELGRFLGIQTDCCWSTFWGNLHVCIMDLNTVEITTMWRFYFQTVFYNDTFPLTQWAEDIWKWSYELTVFRL